MKYKQGDIVLVPFPYTDNLSVSKQRPVIILSKNSINKTSYIVAKITSVIRNDYFGLPIFKIDIDFDLPKPSEIRTNEIMTVDETLIIKKIGCMKKTGLQKVIPMLQDHLEVE